LTRRCHRFSQSKIESAFIGKIFGKTFVSKIADDDFLAGSLENIFHKLDVLRMDMIGLLSRLARKNQIEPDLISLIHDRAQTRRHLADVELNGAGDCLGLFQCAGNQFVGGVRTHQVGPEDDDVREYENLVITSPPAAGVFRAKMPGGLLPPFVHRWRARLAPPVQALTAPFIRLCAGSIGCRFGLVGLACLFLTTGCATGFRNPLATSNSPAISEERAAYVTGFGEFVEWPAKVFTDPRAPFVIGIYGSGSGDEKLLSLAQGRRINGRVVVILTLASEKDFSRCQILFVRGFQKKNLPGIVARLKHASVLTVSEDLNDFDGSGVMINLFSVEGKTLFEVNRDATESAGLKISSKLLSLAQP
jgi:hypothetical protein